MQKNKICFFIVSNIALSENIIGVATGRSEVPTVQPGTHIRSPAHTASNKTHTHSHTHARALDNGLRALEAGL